MLSTLFIRYYVAFLIFIFSFSLAGTIIYPYIHARFFGGQNPQCCFECRNLVNSEGSKKCTDAKELSKECQNYFAKFPNENIRCANNSLVELGPTITPKPGSDGRLANLKTLYGSKVWKGNITGSQKMEPVGGNAQSHYGLEISELRVDFDHEDLKEPNLSFFDPKHFQIPLRGQGVYQAGRFNFTPCDVGYADVHPAIIPLQLDGYISFTDNTLIIDFERFEKKMPELDLTCMVGDNMMHFPFLLEDLMEINVITKYDGDKISVVDCNLASDRLKSTLESQGVVCTASGSLTTGL